MDDGNTATVTIEVSRPLYDRAAEVGVDVARVVEKALRQEVRDRIGRMSEAEKAALREKIRAEIKEEVEWYNEFIAKNGLLSDSFRKFC